MMNRHPLRTTLCAALLCCTAWSTNSLAQSEPTQNTAATETSGALTLKVIDSYLEMHTGPGRGYTIFHVVEQGERITVLTRRPDWYEVRTYTKGGKSKTGWVKAAQLGRTLLATGEPADLPTVSYGDYTKNRWRVGFAAGQLSGEYLKNAETFSAALGYQPLAWLGLEFEAGKFYGADVRGTQLGFNLIGEPFSHWRLSPALVLGYGQTEVTAQPKLIPLEFEKENHQNYGLRLNFYAGRNFIVRGEYRKLSIATDSDNGDFDLWNFGFNTFF